jgi:hypothetical protein
LRSSKKVQVEAELKEAISSLRKPNREVVGKALAEAAERRATVSLSAKSTYAPHFERILWLTQWFRSKKAGQKLFGRIGGESNASKRSFQGYVRTET